MLILEIAAQGVRGVSPSGGSARLRPGYNVLSVDGAALFRLLDALFHPARDAQAYRAGTAPPGTVRAGVTLVGNDGLTYRLLRDFGAGSQLHQFDPRKRAFALAAQEPAAIAELLEGAVGVPTTERLALLNVSAADLPSRSAAPAGNGPLSAPPRPALTGGQLQKRRAELADELERSRKAEKLQYRLDGVQSRLFKLEEVLKEGARLREAAAAAELALAALGPAAAVAEQLGDLEEQLTAHGKAVARRDEALAKVASEREALEADAAPPLAFWKDVRFWLGCVGGSAAAIAAVAGSGAVQGLRYVALLDIPAFGWAAWIALGWVGAVEAHGRAGRRTRLSEEYERKVTGAFERETQPLRDAAKALCVAGVAEVEEALGKLAAARAAVAEVREHLRAFEARPETRSAEAGKARIEAELHEVEAELAAQAGGFVRDPRTVEAEMRRLEEEAHAEAGAAPALSAPVSPAEPLQDLLERAARELGGTAVDVARSTQTKASQLLQAFSGDRFSGLGVDGRGDLVVAAAGRSTPAAGLAPTDRDVVFLALKFAVMERALAEWKLVALADDAFAGLAEAARRRAARMLKQVARPGQLVHATTDVAFRESADHLA